MKKTLLFLMFMIQFHAPTVFGQNLISTQIEQDGKKYGVNHVFTGNQPMIFHSDTGVKGDWKIDILCKDGKYETLYSCNESQAFTFNIDGIKWNWDMAERIYDTTCNRDLFSMKLTFISDEGENESINLSASLLPERPKISNVEFRYTYNWEYDSIWPDGYFSFICTAKGATKFTMHFTKSFLFEPKNLFFCFTEFFEETDTCKIAYDADWGEFICVSAGNQFGWVSSDTILTTDYITDEDILKRIEELKEKAEIKTVNDDKGIETSWNNGILSFNKEVESVKVIDISGRMVKQKLHVRTIDLTNLPQGLYIISYESANNIMNTIKISKR